MIKKAHIIRFLDRLEDHLSLGSRRILLFFLSVTVAIHYCGCFWYYIAKINNFGPDTWVYQYNYQNNSDVSLYIASIYWTVTTLTTCGFGDIHAYNDCKQNIYIYIIIIINVKKMSEYLVLYGWCSVLEFILILQARYLILQVILRQNNHYWLTEFQLAMIFVSKQS